MEKGVQGNIHAPQHTCHVIQTTPFKELWDIVGYCSRNTMLLITWYDAGAHQILWKSMDINPTGKC